MADGNQGAVALTADYQATFSTPHGKRVLMDLMKKGGMLSTSYVPKDPHGTSFNEGQRSLVLHIQKLLKLDVKKLQKQIEEYEHEDI